MGFLKNKDCLAGTALAIFSCIYLYMAWGIRKTNIDRLVGSRFFPQLCGSLLLVLSVLLLIKGILSIQKPVGAGIIPDPTGIVPLYKNTAVVLASFAVFIWLMDLVGFVPAALVYLFTQMMYLFPGKITKLRILLYATLTILFTISVYALFTRVFYLMLPRGSIF